MARIEIRIPDWLKDKAIQRAIIEAAGNISLYIKNLILKDLGAHNLLNKLSYVKKTDRSPHGKIK